METTINEVEVNGVKYVRKDSLSNKAPTIDGFKPVLVRSYAAGVHFGYLAEETFTPSGKVVKLVKTRRVWYWDGAASLSQMALEGVSKPQNCKISVEVSENEIVNVIETLPLTEKALDSLYKIAPWKQ